MNYKVELAILETQTIVSIASEVAPAEIAKRFQEALPMLHSAAERQGAEVLGPPLTRFFKYEPTGVIFESAIPVAAGFTLEDANGIGLKLNELPSGKAARTVHVGPYSGLPAAYAALESWIQSNGYEFAGAPWEVYLAGPQHENDFSKWRTEIYWPVRK
jgi:effector-binding domain-containing protein